MTKKIIIADDDTFVTLLYKDTLEHAGYEPIIAADGVEALELTRQHMPDLLLLDLVMPRLDGFKVLQQIKSDPTLQSVQVAVLSNLSQNDDERTVRELGAVDYLVKVSLAPGELVERLKKILKD